MHASRNYPSSVPVLSGRTQQSPRWVHQRKHMTKALPQAQTQQPLRRAQRRHPLQQAPCGRARNSHC